MKGQNLKKRIERKYMNRKVKNGMIFGKFYPLHIGHVDFIQRASGYVDNLYVVVCTDDERDERLFRESAMKKMPTIKDRIRFVTQTFKHQKNIKVLHLAEDGIPSYPNGWKGWSDRVKEMLAQNKVKIDVIFTNEPQDVKNYKDNFTDLTDSADVFNDNLEVRTIDTPRSNFNISATEIRKNPYKNWYYIPRYVREFFILKIAIVGGESVGKTNLTHKLANYYNTTYVKEYRKEYIGEELQGNKGNIQYEDYSKIAYGHNQKIGEAIKNAHKLTVIDTEFTQLQSYYMETNRGKGHAIIEDFIKNSHFDIILYVDKIENKRYNKNSEYRGKKSEVNDILEKLLKGNNTDYISLTYENEDDFTEVYSRSIDIINRYVDGNILLDEGEIKK